MRTNRGQRFAFVTRAVGLAGALFLLMGANNDNGCAPDPGGNGECSAAADCVGQDHPACDGEWHCSSGQCDWQCTSNPPPTGCYSDADCTGGLVCNAADVCLRPPGCEPGAPCPAVCYGQCVEPTDPPPTGCYSSQECRDGQHCSTEDGVCNSPPGCGPGEACPAVCYGACVDDTTNPGDCWSDSDCAYGETCNFDDCNYPGTANGLVACPGTCEAAETCSTDAECGAGEVCTCAPFAGDASNFLIPCMLTCQPDPNPSCESDRDCAAGQVCKEGTCVDGGTSCGPNGEICGPGEVCETTCSSVPCDCADGSGDESGDCACPAIAECRSQCVPAGGECASDADCRDGYYCGCNPWIDGSGATPPEGDAFWCEPMCLPREGTGCMVDSECGAGFHCERTNCPTTACDCDPSFANCTCPGEEPCMGQCVADGPTTCTGDWDCGPHEMCGCANYPADGEVPADGSSDRVACLLQCIPRPWDCSYDSDCESGRCELVVCAGAAAPPCDPADANCDPAERPAMPEPACWGYCTDPGPGECGANGECPAGYHCGCGWPADGSATDIACYPMCVPDDPDPGHCTSNADCGDHEYCGCGPGVGMQNGLVCNLQCLPEPYDCSQNSDCESGVCNFEICSGAADPMPCDGDGCANRPAPPAECKGYCAPPDEPMMCDADGQCPDGYHCGCGNPFQGSGGGMPNGIACYLQCVPDGDPGTCNGDGDCRDGQHCVITAGGGWCVDDPADQCMDDRDCAANQHCERDVCPAAPCTYDEATGEVVCPPCYGTCQDDPTPTTCQRTGCSGQVCAAEPVYTTCEWREYYQCFQLATCGANDAGACGWQGNDAFRECMQAHGGPASF